MRYLPFDRFSLFRCAVLYITDCFWLFVLGRSGAKVAPSDPHEVCVAKIDQGGDLLIASAALRELKAKLVSSHVVLVTGTWNSTIAKAFENWGYVDEVVYLDMAGCNKGIRLPARLRQQFSTVKALFVRFKGRPPDVWIDLRQRSPNTLLIARLIGAKWRMGYGMRGFRFTLHSEIPLVKGEALGDSFLRCIGLLGFSVIPYTGPALGGIGDSRIVDACGLMNRAFVVVHPFSRERDREIPDDLFEGIVVELGTRYQVVVVGTADDIKIRPRICDFGESLGVVSLVGKTRFTDLFNVVQKAAFVVCGDSMVCHLALGFGKKTFVIMRQASVRESYPTHSESAEFLDSSGREDVLKRLNSYVGNAC